jgi:cell division protease FtsH
LKAHRAVTDPVIERIAAQAQGLSVADLERILAEASVMAIAADGMITDEILSEAFEKLTMGEARVGYDQLRTARHEAGHALVMCLTGSPPVYVTTVGRGNFGGYAALDVDEAKRIYTRKQLEDTICQLLAGRESECLYFGEVEGVSSGASNDIARATNLAELMVYEFGMTEDVGPLYISPEARMSALMADLGVKAVRKIVEEQRARAKASLVQHKVSLDRLSSALSEQGRLLKHEVLALIANDVGEPINRGVSR